MIISNTMEYLAQAPQRKTIQLSYLIRVHLKCGQQQLVYITLQHPALRILLIEMGQQHMEDLKSRGILELKCLDNRIYFYKMLKLDCYLKQHQLIYLHYILKEQLAQIIINITKILQNQQLNKDTQKNSIFGFEVSNIYGSSDFFASSLSFPSRLSLTYYNCSRSEYWTIRIKSTVIAENTYSQEYNAQEALISSASSALMIGASAFVGLQNQLSGLCQQQKDFYLCDCTDKTLFPSIYFNTELETTLQVAPNAYLIPRGSGEFCTLGVTVSEYPFMIFGDAFMKNYFIAFDKENNKIGISIPQKP
eukprot:TRINITY_DN6101_c0_g1_i5.p1 TRINITY_DN6101_c0_g1~~TRINITY_DN6101_c0_g1_i5.p1  ORF type:complete len:306 (-),score=23.71 TRINITY_DN6101_c0_g1_i5:76-993(-)